MKAPARSLSARSSSLLLAGLWLSAGAIWYFACFSLKSPRMFGDELNYWDMARSFHQGARIPYWSVNYDVPTQLYSLLISPVFAWRGLMRAYAMARLVTPFISASVVFPAYLLAREFLEARIALGVALLSVAVPGMAYSSTLMTENLFYPLFVAAFWSAYRVLQWGRVRDSLVAAFFFIVAYYTKPHIFVMIVSYAMCVLLWFVAHRGQTSSLDKRSLVVRLIPVLAFGLAILPRVLALPPGERQLGAVLFGRSYQELLLAQTSWRTSDLVAAWSGLVLASLIATMFVPLAAFVFSVFRLKAMDSRRRWFWLFTVLVWLAYTGLVARHTVLNDGSVRIHERYVFMIFPAFFVWYFLIREDLSRRMLAAITLAAMAIAAMVMRWPAHVFLTPHVNSDAPSLTGFLWLAWTYDLSFLKLALLAGAMGAVAGAIAFAGRRSITVAAWALLLVWVSLGWLQFERQWINPLHVRLQTLASDISTEVGGQRTLGIMLKGRNWLPQFQLDFWMQRPTILYGVDFSSTLPGSFNRHSPYVRPSPLSSGELNFGEPAPDYLITDQPLSETLVLVKTFSASSTLYLYRIGARGESQTSQSRFGQYY